jgi:membrane-bound serine protease (ClpP class)
MVRKIVRIFYLSFFICVVFGVLMSSLVGADSSTIEVLTVDGTIVPVVSDYIDRCISDAEAKNSTACIIELNTPGGLLDSTEEIVQRILNAEVPVVVYVSPSGGWAASAGTFITISSHVAVMAPGTTIGAAHPVSGSGQDIPEDVKKKVVEYSAAWIRSIAETRGRDPVQAELAVTESKSFTVAQALEYNLIDFQANDLASLVVQLDGREVTLASGETVILDTDGRLLVENGMNFVERFLRAISDPNIAYILMSLATIGLITEISNPGLIFPGVAGGLCLLIALYSLGTLNAYWAGIILMLLSLGLFVAEIFTPTFGILTAGGITSMVVGSLLLFSNNPAALDINRGLIAVVAVVVAVFAIFVIGMIVRGQRRKVETGEEALVGKIAVATSDLTPRGTVLVEGEHWTAMVDGNDKIKSGENVVVTKVEGLKLLVTREKNDGGINGG